MNRNPYSANPFAAQETLAQRRQGLARAQPNRNRVGMIEVGQAPGGSIAPAAASPVFGGFGAQPNLHPVREVPPTELRGSALGFDQVVAAAGAAVVTSRPQQAFRPEKLVVGAAGAANFLITDIKIGNTSMLLNATGIPAEAFTPDAVGVHLRWKTAQPAQDVVLDVTEIGGVLTRFLAVMTGTVAE